MLFKGTATRIGRGHRADDRLDRRPARRVHREGIRRLLHQGARRAPAARRRPADRHRDAPGVRAGRHRAREEGRSSKRSRWSRTRPTISSTSCSRSSSGKDHPLGRPILGTPETVASFDAESLRDYFARRLRRAEPDRRGRRQPRARAACASSSSRRSRRSRRPASRSPSDAPRVDAAGSCIAQQGHRAEPRLPRHAALSADPRRPLRRATC